MADIDQISDQEKMKIVSEFISQAPPGQFPNVLSDVRTLLDNDTLLKSGHDVFMKFHKDQLIPVKVDDEHVVLSHQGANGDTFVAPNSGELFTFDPMKSEASSKGEKADTARKHEPYRTALDASVKKYVSEHYPKGVSSVYASEDATGRASFSVLIETHEYRHDNYYAGNWRGAWTVTLQDTSSAQLTGVVKVQVHYYEEGNIQLLTTKNFDCQLTFSSEQSLAQEVMRKIASLESKFQEGISDAYAKFQGSTFKSLRRALPITQARIQWDQIAAYKIGSELAANAQ